MTTTVTRSEGHHTKFQPKNAPDETGDFHVHGGFAAVNRGADYVQPLVQSPLARNSLAPLLSNASIASGESAQPVRTDVVSP